MTVWYLLLFIWGRAEAVQPPYASEQACHAAYEQRLEHEGVDPATDPRYTGWDHICVAKRRP